MRLVGLYGSRNAVNRLPCSLLPAGSQIQTRNISTKPRHERAPPVIEHIDLRTQPNPRAQSIAVLGGGVTGLTTAWRLSRFIPDAKITLYEKQDRLGGWLDSEVIEVDEGRVIFEWGPRSLRPDLSGSGRATLLLLLQLGLDDEVVTISKTSPAALNRYIYYGGRLVKMPGPSPGLPVAFNLVRNLFKIFTEPIFKGTGSLFVEPWVQTRPANMIDESVGDFISRRFGKTIADNVASAFFHGIYAGDLYKLSVRTLLPALWHMETRDPAGNGVLAEMTDLALRGQGLKMFKHGRYIDLLDALDDHYKGAANDLTRRMYYDTSVYTFTQGLGTLSRRMQKVMQENPNIDLRTSSDVTKLEFDSETKQTAVITKNGSSTLKHDYVVSTLSAGKLLDFAKSSSASRGTTIPQPAQSALEESNKAVSVAVVNLYYSNPDLIPSEYRGFGYLIPRSVDLDQNPERGLGVIFGSESSGLRGPDAFDSRSNAVKGMITAIDQVLQLTKDGVENLSPEERQKREEMSRYIDEKRRETEEKRRETDEQPETVNFMVGQDSAPGTKLTVMLGGHWWDGWTADDMPDEATCISMAKSLLERHLKITVAPTVAKARVNRDCIPQYTVGYRQRMAAVHGLLMTEFQGRLKVAGPWWQGGVGVNDCVLSAHMTAFNVREGWDDQTGLNEYTEPEKWLIGDQKTHTFVLDQGRHR